MYAIQQFCKILLNVRALTFLAIFFEPLEFLSFLKFEGFFSNLKFEGLVSYRLISLKNKGDYRNTV